MVDWNRKFRSEYDAAREVLASAAAFDPAWQPVVAQLAQLMGVEGFGVARAEILDELRRRATQGGDGTRVDEAEGLLSRVQATTPPFDSPDGHKVVATVTAGLQVFVVGMQYAPQPKRAGALLVETPLGLMGWHRPFPGQMPNDGEIALYLCNQVPAEGRACLTSA